MNRTQMAQMSRKLSTGEPQSDRDRKFCEAWLSHFDCAKAYVEAGFKSNAHDYANGVKKYAKYAPFLQKLAEGRKAQVGAQTGLKDADIINAMVGIAFCNPQDYFEEVEVLDEKGVATVELRPIPVMRLKPHLAQALSKVTFLGKMAIYSLPSTKDKLGALTSLGKNFGMFLDAVIQQKHLHIHQHKHLDFKGVPAERLADLEGELIEIMGPQAYVMLGLPAPEVKDA